MTADLLDVNDACRYLDVSRSTLYRLFKDGKIKMTKVRGSTRFRRAELDRYLAANERDHRGRVA